MLAVVCWRWKPALGYRSNFGPETVNILRSMVDRHYLQPHRFICVTDNPAGIDADVEIVPLWTDLADLPSPHGRGQPSCYRRLKMFSAEAEKIFGRRFVSLDLDCVITGDLGPLWDTNADFQIWGDTNPTTHYNGSMILMNAAARREVWDDFDPARSPGLAKASGQFGSDQGWISHRLGPGETKWTRADGVYSYRNELALNGGHLPRNARVVFFHGRFDPWSPEIQRKHAWVREHWR